MPIPLKNSHAMDKKTKIPEKIRHELERMRLEHMKVMLEEQASGYYRPLSYRANGEDIPPPRPDKKKPA